MIDRRRRILMVALAGTMGLAAAVAVSAGARAEQAAAPETCQASVVLTVAESKRLIAKGVAQHPAVKIALAKGMVIVNTGTTTTYVAEELLGEKLPHGEFVTGRTIPAKGGKELKPVGKPIAVIVIRNGKRVEDLTLDKALEELKAGDVVIKGANALDYENKVAGVIVQSSTGGTVGKIMPYVVGRKAVLVIPVGLEKLTPGIGTELGRKMREPMKSITSVPSMFTITGEIVTELEALKLLGGVEAFQAASGGVGGAEGGRWLIFRGSQENVEKTLKLVQSIQGEPPFVP
jgi:hypothetical protein